MGIATAASSGLFGTPTLYTTYTQAVEYIPTTRYTTSYILVEPKTDADVAHIKRVVASLGYVAYSKKEFMQRISRFYKYETSVDTNVLLMTVISFIVGLSISGQTIVVVSRDTSMRRAAKSTGRPVVIISSSPT